jgi:hypothetical protein
LAAAAF